MQDPKIIGKLKRNDGAALKTLFKTLAAPLYRIAYRMSGRPETADQVVRAVFRDLWKRRHTLDPLEHVDTDLMRETYLKARALQPEDEQFVYIPNSSDPELSALAATIAHLPYLPRLVFMLHAVDGMSYRNLARMLDLPEDSVTALFGKGLELLEERIQPGVH